MTLSHTPQSDGHAEACFFEEDTSLHAEVCLFEVGTCVAPTVSRARESDAHAKQAVQFTVLLGLVLPN